MVIWINAVDGLLFEVAIYDYYNFSEHELKLRKKCKEGET